MFSLILGFIAATFYTHRKKKKFPEVNGVMIWMIAFILFTLLFFILEVVIILAWAFSPSPV